jgi:hypothetical protein
MKKFLLLILIFSAGFLVGKLTHKSTPPTTQSSFPVIEKKAFLIADKELRNYAMAVEARAKLKAADELYGKVVLLFLADLNLHLDLPQEPKETKWTELDHSPKANEALAKEGELDPSPFTQFKQTTHDLREKFEKMEEKTHKEKTLSQLKKVEVYKLAKYSSKITKEINKMMGEFKGDLKIQTGKNKGQTHSVHLVFDFVMDQKKLEGQSRIELSNEKGEIYSSSTGEGSNQSLLQSKDNPSLIFIHCSPDTFLAINLETFPKLIAEYYESDEFRGTANLKKINP